jgi:hypothetical protein
MGQISELENVAAFVGKCTCTGLYAWLNAKVKRRSVDKCYLSVRVFTHFIWFRLQHWASVAWRVVVFFLMVFMKNAFVNAALAKRS